MYKDSTYKEKFAILKEWTPDIIETVKKDLKNEHLKQDFVFAKKYMPGKNLSKVTSEDLASGYGQAIQQEESGEKIAEFIANRWMIQSAELYAYFENALAKINPDFDKIEEIENKQAQSIISGAVEKFGSVKTYIFAVINSVAFGKTEFADLEKKAQVERKETKDQQEKTFELKSAELMKQDFETRLKRLEDKYEGKLEGLQKKYIKDTDMLKKQVATLQRKLGA